MFSLMDNILNMNFKSRKPTTMNLTQLPKEYIDWFSKPITRFIAIESAAGIVLFIATLCAVIIANSPLSESYAKFWELSLGITIGSFVFERSLHSWINDAAMTIFFFLIALELKRELVLGELRNPKLAMLSISAALGGMLVPAFFYLTLQIGEPGQNGWGTVMATDTAFVIGCLALLGKSIPKSLRVFMLSMAVVDDIGAILVVAIGYGEDIKWLAICFSILGFLMVRLMSFMGIRSIGLFSIAGILVWLAVDASGVHPTLTGVILGLLTPTSKWVSKQRLYTIMNTIVSASPSGHWSGNNIERLTLKTAGAAAREVLSPVERLEIMLHPWVGFLIMPLFALANAGVVLERSSFFSPITLAVLTGFVFGKPIGVLLFSWFAVKINIAKRPDNLQWNMIIGGGMLAGIGFTMALFIAELAYTPEQIQFAKIGIFSASILSASLGFLFLRYCTGSPSSRID